MSESEKTKVSSTRPVYSDMQGLRADQYLVRLIGRISRERAQRIIGAKDFLLDGQAVKPSARVRVGQRATLLRFAPDQEEDVDRFVVDKIYEDDSILVINKPPGMSIHPSANCLYKTLTHWLRKNYPKQKINPCHRIDKETSGIVVCAKDRASESVIKKSFMKGLIIKTYMAVVEGRLQSSSCIDIPLGLQGDRGLVAIRMIKDPEGKMAKTKVRPLLYDERVGRTLVMCRPMTGRQHQIRAHLSMIGHPIVADKLYGQGDEFFDSLSRGRDEVLSKLAHHRHALHASRISLVVRGKKFIFRCAMPKDFDQLISLRK